MSDRLLLVARVAGAFGVKGELRITTFTAAPLALRQYKALLREDGSPALALTAARPVKGAVLLGLAVAPDADSRLEPVRRESWSERLKATLKLTSPGEVDDSLRILLRQAWERAG